MPHSTQQHHHTSMLTIYHTTLRDPADSLHDAAHALLSHALASNGIADYTLSYGAHGKPYLSFRPDIRFSLSHAGQVAVCALYDQEIGIDVADLRMKDHARILSVASRFFAPPEIALLEEAPAEDTPLLFTRLFAAKESYIKYTGNGMSEDLSSFYVSPLRDLLPSDHTKHDRSDNDPSDRTLPSFAVYPANEKARSEAPLAVICEPLMIAGCYMAVCTKDKASACSVIPPISC